jgi:hypothetical protein
MSDPTPILVGEDCARSIFVWRISSDFVPVPPSQCPHLLYIAGYSDIDRQIHKYYPGLLFYARRRLPSDYGPLKEAYGGTHVDVLFAKDMCFLSPAIYRDVREELATWN